MKTGLSIATGAIGVLMSAAAWSLAAAAQPLANCDVGVHAVDEAGITGTITGVDAGMCTMDFDDGTQGFRMPYVLRPADGAPVDLAAPLPDGTYDCAISAGDFSNINIQPMGQFDFAGATYRFRPLGNVTDDFAPYSVAADGSISWGGRVGALADAPSVILRSYRVNEGLNVEFLTQPGADSDTMSCHPL
jgi:hypothetical protein